MSTWLIAPFSNNEFMRNALVAGILVSVLCAVAGTFVVLRGLAFIGDALAHGVLPEAVVGALKPALDAYSAKLPRQYKIEIGGVYDHEARSASLLVVHEPHEPPTVLSPGPLGVSDEDELVGVSVEAEVT